MHRKAIGGNAELRGWPWLTKLVFEGFVRRLLDAPRKVGRVTVADAWQQDKTTPSHCVKGPERCGVPGLVDSVAVAEFLSIAVSRLSRPAFHQAAQLLQSQHMEPKASLGTFCQLTKRRRLLFGTHPRDRGIGDAPPALGGSWILCSGESESGRQIRQGIREILISHQAR